MAEAVISIKEGLAYIIKKGNRQAGRNLPSHQSAKSQQLQPLPSILPACDGLHEDLHLHGAASLYKGP